MSDAEPITTAPATHSLATSDADVDWPARLTNTLVGYVDAVRQATTGKALVASRMVVYFLAIALIAIVSLVLILVLLVRLLVVASGAALPFVDTGEVWFAYLVLGVSFLVVGMILWRKKEA